MPGYNKSLSKLSPPVSPPKEIERIITDIYDNLNNLSGGSSTSSSQNITITTATGGGSGTLSHPNTSGQSSVDNTGVSVIQDVTLDNFGHVTSLASKDLVDEFVPDKGNLVLQNSASGGGSLTYNQTNKQFEYTPPAAASGDITEIVTNTTSGLSGGTTSGVATLSLNISRLTDMTEDVAAIDEIAILDGTTNKRKPLGEIDISVFNNDSGFITSASNLSVTTVTASTGILFGSDTAAANTLDDYEEGTFTPTIHAGASSIVAHSNNYGKYTKIGDIVHCSGRFQVSSLTPGSSSTNVELGGLPFVANTPLGTSTGAIAGSIGLATGFAGEAPTTMQIRDGETNAFLYFQNSSLAFSNLRGDDFGTGAHSIVFQITYHV